MCKKLNGIRRAVHQFDLCSLPPSRNGAEQNSDSEFGAYQKSELVSVKFRRGSVPLMLLRASLLAKMTSAVENLVVKETKIHDQLDDLKREEDLTKLAAIELLDKYNEKVEEVDGLEALNRTLIVKERMSNDQLQDARKEMINGLRDVPRFQNDYIGVRRMGEIDHRPLLVACQQRFPNADDAAEQAALLCSQWQEQLKNTDWYPFRIVTDGDDARAIINEDDEKLKGLRNEWGEEVYEVVTIALVEMNEYNPCGGYPVHELWNYEYGRAATLREVIKHVFAQCKNH